ncbi:MAG TPA: YdcF family protein [Candidatus Aquilonibacter sp.]|nr:YdcF family protein [Candidatus Aquilonibacter sp.]
MKRLLAFTLVFCFLVLFCADAGSFLIIDRPRPSDVIVVLAGETNRRPERALQLLSQGYARRVVLDVPANSKIYEFTQVQLAQQYIRDLPQGASVSVCPIEGLSTKAESKDVASCLARVDAKSVLLVTSDFHTRRALSVFRRELPQYTYSVAASRDHEQFGSHWWTHRQWAKTLVDEWLRMFWWKTVDQWRR